MADSEFYKSTGVDLLLDAEIFFDIMCAGRIKRSTAQPTWQNTLFGWIASGNLLTEERKQQNIICHLSVEQLNSDLNRLLQIEHDER